MVNELKKKAPRTLNIVHKCVDIALKTLIRGLTGSLKSFLPLLKRKETVCVVFWWMKERENKRKASIFIEPLRASDVIRRD